jgi:hypothetical protein
VAVRSLPDIGEIGHVGRGLQESLTGRDHERSQAVTDTADGGADRGGMGSGETRWDGIRSLSAEQVGMMLARQGAD